MCWRSTRTWGGSKSGAIASMLMLSAASASDDGPDVLRDGVRRRLDLRVHCQLPPRSPSGLRILCARSVPGKPLGTTGFPHTGLTCTDVGEPPIRSLFVSAQRQSTAWTSTGSRTPLSVTGRGSDSANRIATRAVDHRSRHEDLLLRRRRTHPGGDVDAAADVVPPLARRLGRVEPDPDPQREAVLPPVAREPALDVDGALDRRRRAARTRRRSRRRCASTSSPACSAKAERSSRSCQRRSSRPRLVADRRRRGRSRSTMSVNMNVRVTRWPAPSGAGRLAAARAEQRIDALQVERRAQPLERGPRGHEVAPGGRRVALGGQRLGVVQTRPGALVRQVRSTATAATTGPAPATPPTALSSPSSSSPRAVIAPAWNSGCSKSVAIDSSSSTAARAASRSSAARAMSTCAGSSRARASSGRPRRRCRRRRRAPDRSTAARRRPRRARAAGARARAGRRARTRTPGRTPRRPRRGRPSAAAPRRPGTSAKPTASSSR